MAKYSVTITQSNYANAVAHVTGLIQKALRQTNVVLDLSRPNKSREQEMHYHALIGEIAKQVKVFGKQYEPEVWKALLVDQFEQEMRQLGKPLRKPSNVVPAMDGTGRLVTVRPSTTKFSKEEGSNFIEFLYAQGVEMGVVWSATAEQIKLAEGMQQ